VKLGERILKNVPREFSEEKKKKSLCKSSMKTTTITETSFQEKI
jgi:hypothetical protein